jgi:sugar lactone lactonase YvrE
LTLINSHWRRQIVAAAAICLSTAALQAALPTFWQVSTEAEFLKGEVDNLAIDSYGRLTLGPTATSIFDSSAPFLWTMVEGTDGSVYVGSGNEGQVHRIDATGRSSVFFDAEELEVHALAAAPGGGLYAATSPDGQIYRLDASGRATPFYDPPDKYIWSLAVDRTGNVFAATGDKGVVYRISPAGVGTRFYETKATHAMSLAFDREGRLLVGSETPGRLFRIDATGKAFVLLDSSYNEIRTLRVAPDGNIYAAALNARPGGGGSSTPAPASPEPSPTPQLTPTVTTDVTFVIADSATVSAGSTAQTPARPAGMSVGAVYRVDADGASDMIWESREDSPYDLAFDADGSVLVATGGKGKIYRLTGDPVQPTLIARINAQQITSMLRDRGGRLLFATANPGKVLRLSSARADRGTYTSEVRDAQTVATWGAIKWQAQTAGGAKIEISTRSGNTRTPDETWSDWSAAYTDPDGSSITSPRARYLQWRAVVTAAGASDAPLLTSVTSAYLPRNMRPRVSSITIHPPGTVFQRPFPTGDPEIAGLEGDTPDRRFAAQTSGANAGGTPNLGRRAYQRGLLTFVWRADDDNRDELAYDVLYRREGETSWKPLRKTVTDQILVWDTTSVPNGRYLVRVVASDAPSNSPGTALTGSMDSTTFEIDNTPPTITVGGSRRDGTRVVLTFDVRDQDSSVQKVEYSLDGDRWQTIYPRDGIADSRSEAFELTLDGDTARGVIIRAADSLNNVASARGDAAPASGRR